MKFKCDQCGTRYTIADEKVRRKVLKIRCKVCEHIMVVRDPEVDRRVGSANTPQPALVAAATAARRPSGRVAAESTVLSPPAPAAASAELEWYAAPSGEQMGPMPIERLVDLVRSGEVARDDVVWNETMADWTPVAEVEALERALRPAPPPAPPAPPAPPRLAPPPPTPDDVPTRHQVPRGQAAAPKIQAPRPAPPTPRPEPAASPADAAPVAPPPARPAAPSSAPPPIAAAPSSPPPAPLPPVDDADDDTLMGAALPFGIDLTGEPAGGPEARPTASPPRAPALAAPLFGGLTAPPAPPAPEPDELEQVMAAELGAGPTTVNPTLPPEAGLFPEPAAPPAGGAEAPALNISESAPFALPTPGAEPPGTKQQSVSVVVPAPPGRRVGLAAAALLLVGGGVGLGVLLAPSAGAGKGDAAVIAAAPVDAGAPTAITPVVDAAAPPPPDAAARPVDAGRPDAAVVMARKLEGEAEQPKPPKRAERKPPKRAETKRPERRAEPDPPPPDKPATKSRFDELDEGKAQVEVAAPVVSEKLPETLDQAQIVGTIKRYQRSITGCYQRQLKRDDSLRRARITLTFQIRNTGRTSNVSLERRYKGTVLDSCLRSVVRRWTFPKFKGEPIPVEYPLIFQAGP